MVGRLSGLRRFAISVSSAVLAFRETVEGEPAIRGREHEAALPRRGITDVPGLYFLGLPWLHKWKSAFPFGAGEDAEYLAAQHCGWLTYLLDTLKNSQRP